MHPELLRIGTFVLPTYGLFMVLGVLAALALVGHRAKKRGLSPAESWDIALWIVLGGLAGSKLLLVVVEWPRYVESFSAFLELFRAAGVFYGGLLGAILVAALLLRRSEIGFWEFADLAAPSVALGQAIGRLGCFSAGCCWGRECHLPWAITFTDPVAEQKVGVPLGIPLHPTQLYEALGTLILCLVLLSFEKRRFSGETFSRYLIGYALLRGTVEFFRGDPRGSLLDGALSTSQFLALVGVLFGVAIALLRRRSAPRAA